MNNSRGIFIAACLVASFLGGAFSHILLSPSHAAAASTTIKAQEFVLVDNRGVEYAKLALDEISHGKKKAKAARFYLEMRDDDDEGDIFSDGAAIAYDLNQSGRYQLFFNEHAKTVWMQPLR